MPKTAVGLFEKPELVDEVVREIEALGFPRKEVRTLTEPATFEVTGVMSFPRLDFEVDLNRELDQDRSDQSGVASLRRRTAAGRGPGIRDWGGRAGGRCRGYHEPARCDGNRGTSRSRTAVTRCRSREHDWDAR